VLGLALSGCSLAGDITPPPGPPGLSTPWPGATTAPITADPLALPVSQPLALEGGLIFQARCAACHGVAGAGDGNMSPQLPAPPPDFSTPDYIRTRTPQNLFATVTIGRMENFMPPFGNSLSDSERWSAVGYLYTLSTPPEQVEAGRVIYEASCADCHGAGGTGDGPRAAEAGRAMANLSDPAYMALRSQQQLHEVLTGQVPAATDGAEQAHPPVSDLADEQAGWAALDYVRTLSYRYAPPGDVLAEQQGRVSGQVVNGTTGAAVPAGLPILLHAFDGQEMVGTLTTTADDEGRFVLDEVAFTPGRQFILTAEYLGVTYVSDESSFTAADSLVLDLPIYETSTDDSSVSVDEMHTFLEFGTDGQLVVGQLLIFSNASDRTFDGRGDARLQFDLPAGASGLNVQGAQADRDFFVTDDGFDAAWVVQPGPRTSRILYSFQLPYSSGLDYAQQVRYPVRNANLLVTDPGISLSGPGLQDRGTESLGGQPFQNYTVPPRAAGETIAFSVKGRPGASAAVPGIVDDTGTLAISLAALAFVLLGIGFWAMRGRGAAPGAATPPARVELREDLLEALAELDEAYQAGEVSAEDYARERDELKADLRKVW
jgi:mono/diheme cytochrome c family protein